MDIINNMMFPDDEYLIKLVRARMQYGKYKGMLLIDIPETYIVWMASKGFSKDSLGKMLQTVYEIKLNGLEYLLEPLREKTGCNEINCFYHGN